MNWLLDYLLGPRTWMVVLWEGGFIVALSSATSWPAESIVKSGLRHGAAWNLARRLKEQARDKPERVS